jgi:hypothetical protein
MAPLEELDDSTKGLERLAQGRFVVKLFDPYYKHQETSLTEKFALDRETSLTEKFALEKGSIREYVMTWPGYKEGTN